MNALERKAEREIKKANKKSSIWLEALKRAVVWMLCTVGVLVAFGLILGKMESMVNDRLVTTFGYGAILATAFVGTPIHELSHLLVALLFGFRIIRVELFRPFSALVDGKLGFVEYAADATLKSQIGRFLAGIAPLALGCVFILLFFRILIPEVYKEADTRCDSAWLNNKKHRGIKSIGAFIKGFFIGLRKLKFWGVIRLIICFYITASIAMHMTLSAADIESGLTGFFVLFLIFYIYGLISAALKADYVGEAIEMAFIIFSFFLIAIICNLLLLGVAELVTRFGT